MLGSYRLTQNVIVFEPQFDLEPNIPYRAVFSPSHLGSSFQGKPATSATFRLKAGVPAASVEVVAIYPTGSVLPENLLKFYVHFSAPMSRGGVYDHITLRHSSGKVVELPFLEIGEELWDKEMTRLTLLFDPGRIKRGVLPLGEIGSSLEAGQSYSLTISRDLRDASGRPLKTDFSKSFNVGPPERRPINVDDWKVTVPIVGSSNPLRIQFQRPLDSALAARFIVVAKETGEPIKGQTVLADEERSWSFVPEGPWLSGKYLLLVQPILEDLSGNNIGKPFDVDLFEGIQRRINTEPVKVSV